MTENQLQFLGEKAVQKAMSLGASGAEAFLTCSKDLSLEVRDQQVDTLKLAEQQGLGVRLFKKNRLGFAYTSDLSETALEQTVVQAAANSEATAEDEHNILPEKESLYPELFIYDSAISKIPLEKKIELAQNMELAARQADPRVKITQKCAYSDSSYEVTVINSQGVKGSYRGAYCGAYAYLVAEENGTSETGFAFQYRLKYDQIDPARIAREAAQKAVRMLGAVGVKTQETTVVLDPYVATGFLGLLSLGLSGEAVQKGTSKFAGEIGRQVAAPMITLVDDGTMENGIMSCPFDGEGVASQRTVLMENGILRQFLYNTYAAAKANTSSTGNASRNSYMGTPEIGTTNFYLQNGPLSKERLLREISRGIYITEVMGMHTANPISGDFSLGAAGMLIEKGELVRPVRGIAIAGNVFKLLTLIDGIGNDLEFFGGKGSPTLRVSHMTISGQ